MADAKIVEALSGFVVYLTPGNPFIVRKGDRFMSDDPVVKGYGESFGDVSVRSSGAPRQTSAAAAETATAAPGERRTPSRASKKGDGESA
jgi:hypothetical protein